MRKLILSMVLVLMMGAFVGPAAEKETSGGLTVIVSDEVGPLPGAIVTISNTQGFVKTTSVQANVRGRVEFPVLRPGSGQRPHCMAPLQQSLDQRSAKIPGPARDEHVVRHRGHEYRRRLTVLQTQLPANWPSETMLNVFWARQAHKRTASLETYAPVSCIAC